MMYEFFIHQDAERDIDELWKENPTAASEIVVQLDEIRGSQSQLDSLTDHDFGARQDQPFHVSKWQHHWRRGNNIWRLKLWKLEATNDRYRIIYAYFLKERQYFVLGVVPRSFDYDPNHPISKRIFDTYQRLSEDLC